MTVKTKVFPVAAVGRIVIVVVVFMVYCELVKVRLGKFTTAPPAHPGVNLQGLRSIVSLAGIPRLYGICDNGIQISFRAHEKRIVQNRTSAKAF